LLRLLLRGLDREAPDRTGESDGARNLTGEIAHGNGDAPRLGVEFAVVEADPGAAHLLEFAEQPIALDDGLRRVATQLVVCDIPLALRRRQRGDQYLAERGAMGGANDADAIRHLEHAGARGLGEHDDVIA